MIKRPVKVSDFRGVNNVEDPENARPGEVQTAINVDVNDSGTLVTRDGRSSVYAGSPDDAFSDGSTIVFRESGSLKTLDATTFTATTIRSGLTSTDPIANLPLNGLIYYSDGDVTGVIENGANRTWGIAVPPQPTLSETVGELQPGKYQVALTYLRDDGQESGAVKAARIDVTTGGISISDIQPSTDDSVDYINVYVSYTDGEVMYRAMTLANGTTSATYAGDGDNLSIALKTQHLLPPPAGQHLAFYNGRIFIADNNVLWYTTPYNYETVDVYTGHQVFPDRITMLGPVSNGIWVSYGNKTSFLLGEEPEKFEIIDKASYGAIEGTAREVDTQLLRVENVAPGSAWIWASQRGICLGTSDGFFVNLTGGVYEFPSSSRGIGLIREMKNKSQYIVGIYYSRFVALPGYTVSGSGTTT